MDWLVRLFSPRHILDEERRAQETTQTLTLVQDFKRELRRDIDRQKRERELRFPLDSVRVDDDDA